MIRRAITLDMPGLYTLSKPAMVLEFWRSEVERLPPKKQEAWKSTSRDCRGTNHQIRFHKGNFQVKFDVKLAKDSVYPIDGWAPVIELGTWPTEEQIQASYGHVMPKGVPEEYKLTKETEEIRAALEGCQLEGFEKEVLRATVVHNAIEGRLTGNHHRNHKIAVPTGVGQPVRG